MAGRTGQVVRAPAVAGSFYPAAKDPLGRLVDSLLGAVPDVEGPCPKALVVPHAGYVYSGPVAASAFARVAPHGRRFERIILVGPAHRVWVPGVAEPGADRLRTPLGEVEVDRAALAALSAQPGVPEVVASPEAHAREHSLEVELPFLQRVAPRARVVPLCSSAAGPEVMGSVLEALWGGPETLLVVSSDLSHYHPYREARLRDRQTADRILALDARLTGEEACGSPGLNGLLWVARRRGLRIELVDLRSSGDTAGPRDEVVGYGAFALYEVEP